MNFDQFRNQVEAAKAELEAYRAAHSGDVGTDTESPKSKVESRKIVDKGQVVIVNEDKWYNAAGQQVR